MLTGKELRLKRLLLLANNAKPWRDHKHWYRQYYCINGSYTKWFLGMAFITEEGLKKLQELIRK